MAQGDATRRGLDPDGPTAQMKQRNWDETTMPASVVFAQRLREMRKARGLTQAQLAARMEAAGHAITDTVLRHIERCEKAKGVSLDDAFALIEALDAVPLYMFTPPDDKFIRLSKSVATDGEGMLGWFVSGLPDRIEPERRQPPPAEITGAVEREQQFARMARLAHALVDADREEDGVRDERMQRAWNALMREARHQEQRAGNADAG